ncbi:MAG: DNA repair and recombination protein RadA [Thermofilum sp.]|nr:DNA repair and recombination protein RadA [Thermofilum sp.]
MSGRGEKSEKELVELLRSHGVGPTLIAKLKGAGLLSMRGLKFVVAATPDELVEWLSLSSYESAVKLREAAKAAVGYQSSAVDAAQLMELEERLPKLATGVKGIDELLQGGLRPGELYEFAGEFGTGKTQLCHQLSVTVQLPEEKGGLSAKAVYIDTEGTFSPQRIASIASRFGLDPKAALNAVAVYRPLNTGELERFVREELSGYLEDGAKLVVIDSVIALYRAQYRGMEWLARRQQAINYLLDWLKRWARIYSAVAVITNQVLTHPLPSGVALKLPAGGNIIAHASTHRFLMRKAGDAWLIECIDSPRIAKGASVQFKITDAGVEDA